MSVHQPKYSKEEFARRGNEIYRSQVRSQVEKDNQGKIVLKDTASHMAINIETGAFEIADTPIAATDLLYNRYPEAQPWVIRIGHSFWYFRDTGTLGDGSEVVFDMYKANVIWDGEIKVIDVVASEAEPLIGMSLCIGFKVQIEAIKRNGYIESLN